MKWNHELEGVWSMDPVMQIHKNKHIALQTCSFIYYLEDLYENGKYIKK